MFLTWCNGMTQARLYATSEEATRVYDLHQGSACGAHCNPNKHRLGRIHLSASSYPYTGSLRA